MNAATQRRPKFEATLSARLPAEAARRIKEMAEADDRPPTTLARRWILDGLRRAEEQAGGGAA